MSIFSKRIILIFAIVIIIVIGVTAFIFTRNKGGASMEKKVNGNNSFSVDTSEKNDKIISITEENEIFTENDDIEGGDDIEGSAEYEVTPNGAKISAFYSTPQDIIDSAMNYIKVNSEYNDNSFAYNFLNNKYNGRIHPSYDSILTIDNETFCYYIEQFIRINKNRIFLGYMVIDEGGNVIKDNLIKFDEFSKIEIESTISIWEAGDIARAYLNTNANLKSSIGLIYNAPSSSQNFCYKIQFEGHDDIIYINGITGEVIE
ncbi:MAG: hypothetical protein FWF94_04140 [Oscillospiraceae bacterium]|nr:hypothetical protein [Oscillospiraceae bacterium]